MDGSTPALAAEGEHARTTVWECVSQLERRVALRCGNRIARLVRLFIVLLYEPAADQKNVAGFEGDALVLRARLELVDGERMRLPGVVREYGSVAREELDEVEQDAAATDAVFGPVFAWMLSRGQKE